MIENSVVTFVIIALSLNRLETKIYKWSLISASMIRQEFGNSTQIQRIDLFSNYLIGEIPKLFGKMNILNLSLANTKLSGDTFRPWIVWSPWRTLFIYTNLSHSRNCNVFIPIGCFMQICEIVTILWKVLCNTFKN